MMDMKDIAARIDHTLLKAEATEAEVDAVVAEARAHGFASVCVHPVYIHRVKRGLEGSGVKACAVIGFPLGSNTAAIKAMEAGDAVERGADEIDIVAHLPGLLAVDISAVRDELEEVVGVARRVRGDVVVKVIVESALLMKDVSEVEADRRIAGACEAVRAAGCDFIKTSTGFHAAGGATERAVTLMKRHAGGLKVKASGGIRTLDDALNMLRAGADRLGCSAGVAIVGGGMSHGSY